MAQTLTLVFCLLLCLTVALASVDEFGFERDLLKQFATKSRYYDQGPFNYTKPPEGCKLFNLQMIMRHGASFPTNRKSFNKLEDWVIDNADKITNPDFAFIKTWRNFFPADRAGQVTLTGMRDAFKLARRVRKLFPRLWYQGYDPYKFEIVNSYESRAGRTGTAFIYGLTKGLGKVSGDHFAPPFVVSTIPGKDTLLRFWESCPNYQKLQEKEDTYKEVTRFEEAKFPEIAQRVVRRLNPDGDLDLDDTLLFDLYDVCRYESFIHNSTRMCTLFDEQDFILLDYYEDLKFYYRNGIGYKLNYEIATVLLNDFFKSINGTNNVYGLFTTSKLRFAHIDTILPLITLMGLYHDDFKFKHDSDLQDIEERQLRTAIVIPYGANLIWAVYQCEDDPNALLVKMLLNEREIFFPACEDEVFCPLKTVKKSYEEQLAIDFADICGRDKCPTCVHINPGYFWKPNDDEVKY